MKNHDDIGNDASYMVFSSINLDKASDRKNFNTVLKNCVSQVNRATNKITKFEVRSYKNKSKANPETLAKISPWFYKVLQGGIGKLINKGISSRENKREVNYDIHKVKKSLAFCKTLSTSPELRPSKRKIKIPKFNLNSENTKLPSRKESDDFLSLTPQKAKIFPFTSRHQNENNDSNLEILMKTQMQKNENNYYVTNIKANKNFSVRKSVALPTGTILKLPFMMKTNNNFMKKSDQLTDQDFVPNSEESEVSVKSETSVINKQEIDPNDQTNRPFRDSGGILKKAPILKRMGTMINTSNFSEKFNNMKSLEILDGMQNQKGSRNSKMYMFNILLEAEASGRESEETKLTDYLDTSTSRSNLKITYENNENKINSKESVKSSQKSNQKINRVSWIDTSENNKSWLTPSLTPSLIPALTPLSPQKELKKIFNNKNSDIISIVNPSPASKKPEPMLLRLSDHLSPENSEIKNASNSHSRNYLSNVASTTSTLPNNPTKVALNSHHIVNNILTSNTLNTLNTSNSPSNRLPSNLKLIAKKDQSDPHYQTNLNNSSNTGNTTYNSQSQGMMSKTGLIPKIKKNWLSSLSDANKTHQNFHSNMTSSEFYSTNPRFHLPDQNKFEKTFDDMLKEKSLIEVKIKKNNFTLPDKKLFIDKTESSIRSILGCDFAPKVLDGVVSNSTGMTSYIEKTRADLLKCSDTISRMNPLSLVRMGGKFVNRYEEYSKAADLDECVEKEYRPFNIERLGRNQVIMQKISKSISQSQKKVSLKNKKPK